MGCKELIASLRSTGEEKARAIMQEAEAEATAFRQDILHRIEELRKASAGEQSLAASALAVKVRSEAESSARTLRTGAEQALAARLFLLAAVHVGILREQGYARAFRNMAGELPSLSWKTVRVNAVDRDLAREQFPQAEIVVDDHITGGMDAATDDDRVRVINTLEKRLERAWTDMLPGLIDDIQQEVTHGTSSTTR